ncbi:hypothetical protein D9M68_620040 [compost metagenome]
MGAAGLEGHHPGLAAGVHHRMGQGRAEGVEALEDLQAGAHPRLRAGIAPGRQRGLQARQQCIRLVLVVAHIQVETVGRALGTGAAHRLRAGQGEVLAEQRLEGRLGALHRFFRVLLEAFREGRPVATLADGLDGAFEGTAMVLEQLEGGGAGGGRHGETPQQGGCSHKVAQSDSLDGEFCITSIRNIKAPGAVSDDDRSSAWVPGRHSAVKAQ